MSDICSWSSRILHRNCSQGFSEGEEGILNKGTGISREEMVVGNPLDPWG